MVHFLGDGIAQSLFNKFTAYESLESTCIGLIGSNNFFNLQQQIVCIIVRHVHLATYIDYPQIPKLDKSGNWKNNYKEYLMPPKMPKYAEKIYNMRTLLKYVKNAYAAIAYLRFSDITVIIVIRLLTLSYTCTTLFSSRFLLLSVQQYWIRCDVVVNVMYFDSWSNLDELLAAVSRKTLARIAAPKSHRTDGLVQTPRHRDTWR